MRDMKQGDKSLAKIVIDTNVWISFLMGKTLSRLENYIYDGHFQIVSCNEQLAELQEVLYRPKMERYFSVYQIKGVFELLADFAQFVNIHSHIDICRDAKDNYLLALSIDSNANFLITGDKDLLSIKQIENTTIIGFKDFENLFLSR
jgi:putative PIN family toxin of toxin-antitoxin system